MQNYFTNDNFDKADAFILKWSNEVSEQAESQVFLEELFEIFGVDRKRFAKFEYKVFDKSSNTKKRIDLLWPGLLLVESKSASKKSEKDWNATLEQAEYYVNNLKVEDRPKIILLSNFKTFRIYNVEQGKRASTLIKTHIVAEIPLSTLRQNLDKFSFFLEYKDAYEQKEEQVNQTAARQMAALFDTIRHNQAHLPTDEVATFLARILFCLFAEDTGIFEKNQFTKFIKENTTDKTMFSNVLDLFEVLNTKTLHRKKIAPAFKDFPYVNGGLFSKKLHINIPNAKALREKLIECASFDWSMVSPVIFGSLFQAILSDADRRSLGAHYTSEKNIIRVLNPLILDELRAELKKLRTPETTKKFIVKLRAFSALDPACGCGNFLVVLYKELRYIYWEAIRKLHNFASSTKEAKQEVLMLTDEGHINLKNFYGIEIDPISAMIAEVALWMTMHQSNMFVEQQFDISLPSIPLTETPQITCGNALHIDWQRLRAESPFAVIVGNPPFIGKQLQTKEQKEDVFTVFSDLKGSGNLDYVAAWYKKAAEFMITVNKNLTRTNSTKETKPVFAAFVSTNSITQGEQVGLLWNYLYTKYNVSINFGHRTFSWSNEAPGVAAVHVVVIGFSTFQDKNPVIFAYPDIKGEPEKIYVKNINPYLVQGNNFAIEARTKPLCKVPEIYKGNQPTDGGFLLLDEDEYSEYLKKEPQGKKLIKNVVSGSEYIKGLNRYCFWLTEVNLSDLKKLPVLQKRIENTRKFRLESTFDDTRKLAQVPHLFRDLKNPESFIVIPATSSENRKYIPFGFLGKNHIPLNSVYIIPEATLYHFGVLTSQMHMVWVKVVCGRLKSDFRYSKDIVYNNFPWAQKPTAAQVTAVEEQAQAVLDIRQKYAGVHSLAELYDSKRMPRDLEQAHSRLDKAVEKCYRSTPFRDDASRVEYLFSLYEEYQQQGMLLVPEKKKRGRK